MWPCTKGGTKAKGRRGALETGVALQGTSQGANAGESAGRSQDRAWHLVVLGLKIAGRLWWVCIENAKKNAGRARHSAWRFQTLGPKNAGRFVVPSPEKCRAR